MLTGRLQLNYHRSDKKDLLKPQDAFVTETDLKIFSDVGTVSTVFIITQHATQLLVQSMVISLLSSDLIRKIC